MPVDVEALRQIPLFASLPPRDLREVAAVTRVRSYQRGELIMHEGDLGGGLHYVHSGMVKVFKLSARGKEQVLHLMGAGQTFNDVPVLDGGPNPASAAAMEESTIYVIGRSELRALFLTRPEVADAVVQILASRLRHLVSLVEDLSLRSVTARVAKILLAQETSLEQGRTSYRLTQQEMAALAGTAREVVGRALKELETAGAIEIRQGRIIVIDRERLTLIISL